MTNGGDRVPIDAQQVDAPLSRFAVFLVLGVPDRAEGLDVVREEIAGIDDLVKTVGFRDLNAHLSCVVGIGARLWDRLCPDARPAELREFPLIVGPTHTAPPTPGDLLFHIRAERLDLCIEFERLLLDALGDAVTVIDETQGYRYFDARDFLGFVDGTANPIGAELAEASLIGDEDPGFAGGSYVVVQKYVHDLTRWSDLTTEQQEAVIGRRKADDVELDDAAPGTQAAHKTLTTIIGDDGEELDILRDNMPFGRPGQGDLGTFFIGYSRRLWVIELMLRRMFLGDPPGLHDRILDVSTALTGTTFFVPSNPVLQGLSTAPPDAPTEEPGGGTPIGRPTPHGGASETGSAGSEEPGAPDDAISERTGDGSLGIGSLRAHRDTTREKGTS
ncbi:Dyp-type peroxidase [Agromyces seonyuensis]|uniref:Dyp-type peroxidase n=1 Tax=Agromyces seonyuensis TaxID=2662446 RepID=A0A6I4P6C1_9MICO|nr:Dyp-type peroxidase [Agromyces seonyuensis]MWC00120.1 Dyp-type peroxidase [Agromyces seonyuensis]